MLEVKQAVPLERCPGLLREALGDDWTIRAKQLCQEEITVAVLPPA